MLQPGTMIGTRYQVIRLLGQGGMSNIYVCQDTRLRGKMWVVKEMTARYSNPEEQAAALKYFEREALLLANLHHPNLPTVNDYFQFQGKYYLVMEYIEGEDMQRMLARVGGPLPERQVAEWGAQIATVLYYLHCQKPEPIIFRDVKPSNLMVSGAKVKLIDFGIARHFNPNKKGDTMRIGSPGYAPPEQYSGQTDPRSDIYALGVTLHQALTGRDPTTTQTPFQLPPVKALNPKVSEEMARIIERATKMLPEERYQSMLEMKRDLQSLVATHRGGTSVVRTMPADATSPHSAQPMAAAAAAAAASPAPAPAPAPVPSPAAVAAAKARKRGNFLARAFPILMILIGVGVIGMKVWGSGLTLESVMAPLRRLWEPAAQNPPGGASLYLEGAPLSDALGALSHERREAQGSGETALYWNNALAGLEGQRFVHVGVVVPKDADGDSTLRGLALAQRALNGAGGVNERLVVLVVERAEGDVSGAVGRLTSGRSGRQTRDAEGTRGQQVEALLVFGSAEGLAAAPTLPAAVVGSSGKVPEGVRVLQDPGAASVASALSALAAGRTLVVSDPALEAALKELEAPVRRGELKPGEGKELFVAPADAKGVEAVLRAGSEVVLLAEDPADLPELPADLRPRAKALVRLSPFHPWQAGAAAARLFPVAFGSGDKAPDLDPAAARAYDALRWIVSTVIAEQREYRGATLAAGVDGTARPAPQELFEATAEGWTFRKALLPAQQRAADLGAEPGREAASR